VAATIEVLFAVAFTSVPGLLPVMSVKDVFAVMVPMRVLFGMPVPVTNMFVCKPVVFVQVTVELPVVIPQVTAE
jgi:hypothetical protein